MKPVSVTAMALEVYRKAGRYAAMSGHDLRHPEYGLLPHIGQAPRTDGQMFWAPDWAPDEIHQNDAVESLERNMPRVGVGFNAKEVVRFLEDKPMTSAQVQALVPGTRTVAEALETIERQRQHVALGDQLVRSSPFVDSMHFLETVTVSGPDHFHAEALSDDDFRLKVSDTLGDLMKAEGHLIYQDG